MKWQLISLILALLGAIFGLIGGILAKSLTPDSAPNVRHLVETLEPFLRTQAKLLDELARQANSCPSATGSLPASTTESIAIAKEQASASHARIHGALSTVNAASVAASARLWMCAGAAAAMLSAVVQIGLLIEQAC